MFVTTSKEGTHISPLDLKNVACKLPKVSSKITFQKCSLIKNANYLVKAMNKFVEGFINVEKHKLELGENMIVLLIKSNEKLAIKQMKFELVS
jgi:hypothetical protein